jgi:hypothetical protein
LPARWLKDARLLIGWGALSARYRRFARRLPVSGAIEYMDQHPGCVV